MSRLLLRLAVTLASISIWINSAVGQRGNVISQVVPGAPTSGPSVAQFVSTQDSFESSHLSSINETVFEWWYYDAVSADLSTYINMIFFASTQEGFPLTEYPDGVTSLNLLASFPNGTSVEYVLPASSATFKWGGQIGNGIVAEYDAPLSSDFYVSPSLDHVYIRVNATELGITGYLRFRSTAPAHYPCSADWQQAGQQLQITPHIGWANAVPSSIADGEFDIMGTKLRMSSALGYHDMNWGDQPLVDLINSWYFGRATLGPYTIVWFDVVAEDGSEHVSGYVAEDGKVLLASCKPDAVKVRPEGPAARYPPTSAHGMFNHLQIVFDLGDEVFAVNVTKASLNVEAPGFYYRWLGHATGGIPGRKTYKGPAVFEEFTVVGSGL